MYIILRSCYTYLSASDQALHPHKTAGILLYELLHWKREDNLLH